MARNVSTAARVCGDRTLSTKSPGSSRAIAAKGLWGTAAPAPGAPGAVAVEKAPLTPPDWRFIGTAVNGPPRVVYVFDADDPPPPELPGTAITVSDPLTIYQAWNIALGAVTTPLVMNDCGCATGSCCPAPFLFHPTSVT